MRFRFVHAADLHLDSPMRGLSLLHGTRAAPFQDATRRAFEALVTRTIEAGAKLLLIAGDVYDGDWKDHGTGLFFARGLSRLRRAGVEVVLVRGNHDAECIISKAVSLPEGVHLLSTRRPQSVEIEELRVVVHGRSFSTRETTENLALAYPKARAGWFNVGLLHTACEGREGHEPYAPCSAHDLLAKGYDYWALGHVHEHEVVHADPPIVFPGNLQGRHARETGPRGAMLVEVGDGPVRHERLIVDVVRWARLGVDVSRAPDAPAALALVEAALRPLAREAGDRPVAVRLVLEGRTPAHRALHAEPALWHEAQAAADRVADRLLVEKVELRTRPPEAARAPDAASLLDPSALLEGTDEAAIAAALDGTLDELFRKLPDDAKALLADLKGEGGHEGRAALLAEARDLALGRLLADA